MNRDRKQRFWDGERFRFPEYYEIETNRYFDTFRDLENNTPIKNLVVSDFTGLTDKNGKEIYEGDILDPHGKVYFSVENGAWMVGELILSISASHREVIGNIHENPELLKP